jgi:type II secretory pathway pseudopilin PulG
MKAFLCKKLKAFSIIEILVAVSIVVILMALGVSAYTKYLAKQMVVKAINATSYLRQAVEDYYTLYGYMPGYADLTTGPGGPYISGYTNDGNGQPKYYSPEQNISRISYYHPSVNCSSGDSNCTSTGDTILRQVEVSFSNPTTVAVSYLSVRTFIMRANVNGGVITWECAIYNWVDGTYSPNGAVDGTLMPVSCYNSALNI